MGILEKEGAVFWSLPDVGYCGDLRPRVSGGILRKKVERCQEVVERDF
jgi:hypothetical protein